MSTSIFITKVSCDDVPANSSPTSILLSLAFRVVVGLRLSSLESVNIPGWQHNECKKHLL